MFRDDPMRASLPLSLALLGSSAWGCAASTPERVPASDCKNQPDGTDCDGGLCCGQACTLFLTDPKNCGACGLACPNDEPCANGLCLDCSKLPDGTACNAGTYEGLCCSGVCANTRVDSANCGGCGASGDAGPPAVCAIGSVCIDAGCVDQCIGAANNAACSIHTFADGTCCNQLCIDPTTDPNNCYNCGTVCGAGQHCTQAVCQ